MCCAVVGCGNFDPPDGATLQRSGDDAVVVCNRTGETWFVACRDGVWLGTVGNCTKFGTPRKLHVSLYHYFSRWCIITIFCLLRIFRFWSHACLRVTPSHSMLCVRVRILSLYRIFKLLVLLVFLLLFLFSVTSSSILSPSFFFRLSSASFSFSSPPPACLCCSCPHSFSYFLKINFVFDS